MAAVSQWSRPQFLKTLAQSCPRCRILTLSISIPTGIGAYEKGGPPVSAWI
jgi:hypothetical protein